MTMEVLLVLGLTLVSSLPLLQQPIPSGAVLLFLAFMVTLLLGYTVHPWYGYILFLIYISGMLVMFGYVCAMSPNTLFLAFPKVPLVMVLGITLSVFSWGGFSSLQGLGGYATLSWPLSGYSLLSQESWGIYWLIATILLLMLVVTVSIVFKKSLPLRSFDLGG